MPVANQRILIVQTAFLGDLILTLPLIQETSRRFPGAAIDLLMLPAWRNLVETHPNISDLLLYDKHDRDRGAGAFLRWCLRLRRRRYSLALVPHRSLRSALLVRLAGIPIRIGFDRSTGRLLFTDCVPYQTRWHEARRNLSLLTPLGYGAETPMRPVLVCTEADHRAVIQWLHEADVPSGMPLVVLAPGSMWATKRWPAERYAQLASRLNRAGYAVALIGGEQDRALCQAIARQAGGCTRNAAGRFSFRQSACLMTRSCLLIGNDSAPIHLAWAVGTPVVAIFGPTVPEFGFFPGGPEDRVVELKELPCRPCSLHGPRRCPVRSHRCMTEIHVETVWAVAEERLNRTHESYNQQVVP